MSEYEEILDTQFGVQNDGEPAASEGVEAKPESETSQIVTEEAEATPSETNEDHGSEEGQEETDKKKRSGVQRLKMKLEREQAEKQALANRLAELESANRPQVATDEAPNPDAFESYPEYIAAMAHHEAKKILAEERRAEAAKRQQAELQEMQKSWEAKEAITAAKHDDYEEVADVQALTRAGYLTPVLAEAIFTSDFGPDLLYWIGAHPEESQRLAGMPAAKAVRELGRIEERLAGSAKTTQPKPKTSAAPTPISPLVARGSAPAPSKFDRFEEF